MTGIELIAKERHEQIEKHGHTTEKDVGNNNNEQLIQAVFGLIHHKYGEMPDEWDFEVVQKMMLKSLKDRLIIAGALIAAEIDRINFDTKQQPG